MQMTIVSSLIKCGGIFSLLGFSTAVDEKVSDIAFKEPIAINADDIIFFSLHESWLYTVVNLRLKILKFRY